MQYQAFKQAAGLLYRSLCVLRLEKLGPNGRNVEELAALFDSPGGIFYPASVRFGYPACYVSAVLNGVRGGILVILRVVCHSCTQSGAIRQSHQWKASMRTRLLQFNEPRACNRIDMVHLACVCRSATAAQTTRGLRHVFQCRTCHDGRGKSCMSPHVASCPLPLFVNPKCCLVRGPKLEDPECAASKKDFFRMQRKKGTRSTGRGRGQDFSGLLLCGTTRLIDGG